MSASGFSALISLLGFVGLASVGLIPFRSWRVLLNISRCRARSSLKMLLLVFAVLIVIVSLLSDMHITARVFKCLTETYCGPSVASGWHYLAMLGTVYVAFEALTFVLQKIGRVKAARPAL